LFYDSLTEFLRALYVNEYNFAWIVYAAPAYLWAAHFWQLFACRRDTMFDAIFVLAAILFFVMGAGFVHACEQF